MSAQRRSWFSTTGKSRTTIVVIIVVAVAFGILIALVSQKAFGVNGRSSCGSVRPVSSRMACQYDHGDYGRARSSEHYPAHFVRLAERAHRRWDRHHAKVALTSKQLQMRATTWWATFVSRDDRRIAFYAAKSKCPAHSSRLSTG